MVFLKYSAGFKSARGNCGKAFSFTDVSNFRNLVNELNQKNEELQAMNKELLALNNQLGEYAAAVEHSTIKEERNRIARDSHDILVIPWLF
jgi:hypothetical protein